MAILSRKKKSPTSGVAFSAKKHLLPPLLGIVIMLCGFGIMNGQWIGAQIINKLHPLRVNQHIITPTASASIPISTKPTIIIPKIGVKAPIVESQSNKESDVQLALRNGVLHYGSTAYPGQDGNTVLFGHSSGQVWSPGNYKFVFTLLNALKQDDQIAVEYEGTRYVYSITNIKVVPPTDFSVIQQTDFPQLTLITCTPVGTSKNRLVVQARQVMPDPAKAITINKTPANKPYSTSGLPR